MKSFGRLTRKRIAQRLDFKVETVKSGTRKDAGNPLRDMTPAERAYWQAMIDRVYAQFLKAVVDARGLPEAHLHDAGPAVALELHRDDLARPAPLEGAPNMRAGCCPNTRTRCATPWAKRRRRVGDLILEDRGEIDVQHREVAGVQQGMRVDHRCAGIGRARSVGAEGERLGLGRHDAMRSGSCRQRGVTDVAGIDRSVMALQLEELQAVLVGLCTGCNGMRAIVAGFAIDAAVPLGKTIQGLVLIKVSAVVAGVAARGEQGEEVVRGRAPVVVGLVAPDAVARRSPEDPVPVAGGAGLRGVDPREREDRGVVELPLLPRGVARLVARLARRR